MKKALSLLLVLVLALGMSTVAFAAPAVYGKNGKPVSLDTTTALDTAFAAASGTIFDNDKKIVDVTLDPAWFTWEEVDDDNNDTTPKVERSFTDAGIRMAEIDKGKVKLSMKVKSGAVLFDTAVIERDDNGYAAVRVKTKGKFLLTSDSEVDYEVEVTMSVNGSKSNGTGDNPWVISGTYDPEAADMVIEPASDDEGGDDISAGQLIKPDGYNPNWVGVLDGDDTIEGTFKLFKGRNFYIYAEGKVGDDDAETVDAYGFDQVYRLTYSANAVPSVKHINFTGLGDGYYVYGSKSGQALKGKADIKKDLVYLGTSDQDLPLYNRYYLAASQVDLDIDDIIDEPTIDAPIPADDGGGDGYIPNVNDNPGTGK